MLQNAIYKQLGEAISTRRNQLKMTQAELASKLAISRASIANIESGRQKVLLHTLYDLTNSLELSSIHELIPSAHIIKSRESDFSISGAHITEGQKSQIELAILAAMQSTSTSSKVRAAK